MAIKKKRTAGKRKSSRRTGVSRAKVRKKATKKISGASSTGPRRVSGTTSTGPRAKKMKA